jgi:hypothetical protein
MSASGFCEIMAKFKVARGKAKAKEPRARGLIPCLILLITAFVLINLLFYAMLKSYGS